VYFCGHFCPPGSGSGYGYTDLIESGSNPDPKHWIFVPAPDRITMLKTLRKVAKFFQKYGISTCVKARVSNRTIKKDIVSIFLIERFLVIFHCFTTKEGIFLRSTSNNGFRSGSTELKM
jgi:hypothetical protein